MTTQDLLDAISYQLRAAAGGARVTNAAAGAQIGVHGSTVGKYLEAPGDMRISTLIRLCGVYGVHVSDLLTESISRARTGGQDHGSS